MKILLQQFLGNNHSWSICGQNIARSLIKQKHEVHLFSTNGLKHFPADLKNNLIGYMQENDRNIYGRVPDSNYDCQISYTAMRNFPIYLSHGSKNRFGIWCYEFAGKNALPTGFAKNYKFCDKLFPPSNFAKQVFLDSGIPEDNMVVIPHGIEADKFSDCSRNSFKLKTKKKLKILANQHQPHIRKNLSGVLEAYGKAFSNKDDVCLILKVSDKIPTQSFEVSFKEVYGNFKSKFKNHGEIEIITEFIEDMDTLYRACDALFSMTNCEGFFFPALEALAAKIIIIVPNYSGQLDFLNEKNALLISGREVPANPKALYWESKFGTKWFEPDIDDAIKKLRFVYNNFDDLKHKYNVNNDKTLTQYSWDNVVNKILNLCV